jgi:hypothetical protein
VRHVVAAVLLVAFALGAPVRAHEILDPVQLNQILKSMERSRRTIESTQSKDAEKHEALFNLGVDAYALMKLINSELKEHGTQNQGLVDLAVTRSGEMSVNLRPVGDGQVFVYDFEAFKAYLKAAPRGAHAAEARFALVEQASYGRNEVRTPEGILAGIDMKQKLLKDFPDLKRRADVEMFLILDYLELSNAYLQSGDAAKGVQYKDRALQLCRRVAEKYPDTDAAMFARNLLVQLGL